MGRMERKKMKEEKGGRKGGKARKKRQKQKRKKEGEKRRVKKGSLSSGNAQQVCFSGLWDGNLLFAITCTTVLQWKRGEVTVITFVARY